jgi:hypothetical protein
MDEPSLKRFVAHKQGRGAEYDDKQAAKTELRQKRGIPEPVVAPPSHGHDHHHFRRHGAAQTATKKETHGHDHGPAPGHKHDKGKTHSHAHDVHAH